MAAVAAVSLLVGLLRDGAGDSAFAQVGAEAAGAVGLVRDDLVGSGARTSRTGPRDPDAVQERTRADAVVALAGCQQDGEGPPASVAGEMDFGGQASSGSAEGVIVWFVRPVDPLFRPVAAACWWARTMVESIWTSQSMSPAASARA